VKEWWIDRSQEAELGPGHPELETSNKDGMTRLDNLIKVSEQVDLTSLPEMFQNIVNPLNQNIQSVMAQLQGGRPIENMFNQMVGLMAGMLEKMNKMEDELQELKSKP
jgi:septation ring formation regulator EzrA